MAHAPEPQPAGRSPIRAVVETLARQIMQDPTRALGLAELSRRSGYSRFHLQRRFKALLGSTPKQYLTAARLGRLRQSLQERVPLSAAIYRCGYGSPSRVYEKIDAHLGMTPAAYRAGGRGVTMAYAAAQTPLGLLLLAATDRGICHLQFGDGEAQLLEQLAQRFPAAARTPMPQTHAEQFQAWIAALNRHLHGLAPQLDLPLDLRGTAFQLSVWRYLQTIPYGEVRSYSQVAQALHTPRGARAVARACASNSLAIAIPCHRVICGNGELGGYRWGVTRKRQLLEQERR
jgi:AraC family transcriptional regulator of adaptative response/methylated-DNA-[protein]-cysteine methyltransferase